MTFGGLLKKGIAALVLLLCFAPPLAAQIEDQLSAYTGANAKGYLQPFSSAFGADLNTGIFRTASIPKMGPKIRLELQIMSVIFGDDDRTFRAVTERGFTPKTYANAPTVVGSGKALMVEAADSTAFFFPGGFDLNSFALAAPQLRVGGVFGTEVILRYFALNIGGSDDSSGTELGNISLFGIGLKHSISQYLPPLFPVNLSAGFFWQTFSLGENKEGDKLISSKTLSIGVQASKKMAMFFEPYAGVSYDTHSMSVSYESKASDTPIDIDVDFEKESSMHLTLGLMLEFPVVKGFAEYNIAGQNSFALGLGFGI
ncbi:MAG: autotransporter domain-containing protein [Candidatus Krumholzibacteria bacterium]|nr:autotransporter domain-containing protein [Candidatus Krumholzibacteria bacterium]